MREVVGVLILLFCIWLHYKSVSKTTLKPYYFPALIAKLLAGIGVGLVYKYYYAGGDTWSYFNQARHFSEVGFSSFSNFIKLFFQSNYELVTGFSYSYQPRAALMVKLVAIINIVSGSNYWVTSLFFSFFSFIGVYSFANWINIKYQYGKMAGLSILIWPSFVFWSSGILKESLAVGLIFYIIPAFFRALEATSIKKVLVVIISLYLLFLIKYYFAVVLIITLLLYAISVRINLQSKPIIQQVLLWVLMLATGFIIGGFMHYNLRLENVLGVIMENNKAFGAMSSPQSFINFTYASQPVLWLLINAPKALFASLFMPLLPVGNVLFMLSSIENWILLALMIRGLVLVRKKDLKKYSVMLIATLTYIITLAVFLALSTPNLGTLSRYKVSFIPIVLVLVVLANKVNYWQGNK